MVAGMGIDKWVDEYNSMKHRSMLLLMCRVRCVKCTDKTCKTRPYNTPTRMAWHGMHCGLVVSVFWPGRSSTCNLVEPKTLTKVLKCGGHWALGLANGPQHCVYLARACVYLARACVALWRVKWSRSTCTTHVISVISPSGWGTGQVTTTRYLQVVGRCGFGVLWGATASNETSRWFQTHSAHFEEAYLKCHEQKH